MASIRQILCYLYVFIFLCVVDLKLYELVLCLHCSHSMPIFRAYYWFSKETNAIKAYYEQHLQCSFSRLIFSHFWVLWNSLKTYHECLSLLMDDKNTSIGNILMVYIFFATLNLPLGPSCLHSLRIKISHRHVFFSIVRIESVLLCKLKMPTIFNTTYE